MGTLLPAGAFDHSFHDLFCLQSPRILPFQLSRKATIGFTLAARRAGM